MSPIHRQQQGAVSLIEVLVALLVLTFGVLGLAGMQLGSMQKNTSALMRTQANELAYDILDRMRANRVAANAGGYDIEYDDGVEEEEEESAAPPTLAEIDQQEWKVLLATILPSGDGEIATVNGVVSVKIRWSENWADNANADTGFVELEVKSEI